VVRGFSGGRGVSKYSLLIVVQLSSKAGPGTGGGTPRRSWGRIVPGSPGPAKTTLGAAEYPQGQEGYQGRPPGTRSVGCRNGGRPKPANEEKGGGKKVIRRNNNSLHANSFEQDFTKSQGAMQARAHAQKEASPGNKFRRHGSQTGQRSHGIHY